MVEITQIRDRFRDAVLHQDPFPYGWIDDFLPMPEYRALEAGFLFPDAHPSVTILAKGKKRILFCVPPVAAGLGPVGAEWQGFLQIIGSRDFRSHCLGWVRQILHLDTLPAGPYRELFKMRQMLEPDDVEMQCEFSNLSPGVLLPPHSDSTDKILSFIHYFTPPGWREEWSGSTEIYRPKDPRQLLNFSNFFLARDAVEIVNSCVYRSNRLFFFVKNDRAWHGVSQLPEVVGTPRLSFNFSLRIKSGVPLKSKMASLHAVIRANEQPSFA
jgi:hypothetical protein